MFEKPISICDATSLSHDPSREPLSGARESDRLRALDWNELTGRLSAARELRAVLNQDRAARAQGAAATAFADAAARFFDHREQGKRLVNPVALEHPKASPAMTDGPRPQGMATAGDARED
ncbi:hypothetical protein [Qipengyuania nanhaisediminis]|uniref:hypothetical protein n=1 Tax=Qipengyuania nanhaisediminis TaxID=604088 RepID=UPI0038B3DDEB